MRYFDCTKFDYKKFKIDDSHELIERDKAAYKHSFTKWVTSEIDNIVERKWEIENIGVVDETGDFIRLIKEAELSYSLGAYYSTIALIGVASEDLCKYFSDKQGYSNLLSKTQFERVNQLKSLGAITDKLFDKFDSIRVIRNDCLHFNQGFKSKDRATLRQEAVNCINDLKSIYKTLFSSFNGTYKTGTLTTSVIEDFAKQMASQTSFGDTLNSEEFTMKLRYFMADEFDIDIAITDSDSLVNSTSIFVVKDIDIDTEPKEIGLLDIRLNQHVVVDISDEDVIKLNSAGVNKDSKIIARITSLTNHQGVSATWNLESFYVAD